MPTRARVALVTAGSAGLGAAIARTLALESGMSVVINYSSNEKRAAELVLSLQEDVAQKNKTGPHQEFHAVRADLHQQSEVRRLVSETLELTGGRLDAVISNHGWTRMTDFSNLEEGMNEDDWDCCFNVNVKAHLWLFYAVKRALDEAKGSFVSTASIAGVKPSGSSLPYAVTKAAQIHLIKSLALIAAPAIRVNCISPGVLLTDWGKSFPQEKLDKVLESNKLHRFATVEDVAEQVRALIECRSITGQNIIIDAGFSL